MTDNIEKIVQEAECVAAADEYFKARTWIMDTADNRRIFEAGFDRAYALLSKLRAPVADSTLPLEKALHELVSKIAPGLDTGDLLQDAQRASAMLDAIQARAALASAPVTGEAKPAIILKALDEYGPQLDWTKHWVEYPIGTKFYAAPQASEAVRDATDMDALRGRVIGAIHDCAALTPEDDESWDEWYCAAFDLLGTRVGDIFRAALSAQPGAQEGNG